MIEQMALIKLLLKLAWADAVLPTFVIKLTTREDPDDVREHLKRRYYLDFEEETGNPYHGPSA